MLQTKLEVIFFKTNNDNEPVRKWLQALPKPDRKVIGEEIKTIQFGWPLGMPIVASLGKGLWEARARLPRARIARVIFFMNNNTMILVNGFIKKTQKTPKSELDLAIKRKHLYETTYQIEVTHA